MTIEASGSVTKNKSGQYEVKILVGPFADERDAVKVSDLLYSAVSRSLSDIEEAVRE